LWVTGAVFFQMNKFLTILTILLSLSQKASAQDFQLVQLKEAERKDKNLLSRYVVSFDNYAGAELFLYKDGMFSYRTYSDVAKFISAGRWTRKADIIELNSKLGKNTVPVKVTYVKGAPTITNVKHFAIINDLSGREYPHTAIFVNNDSVSCFYGDMECFGSYTSIDSVRVAFNDTLSSRWMKVDPTKGIIQLTIQTDLDLNLYFPFHLRLRKEKNMLKDVRD
jgi:hypothetical protein